MVEALYDLQLEREEEKSSEYLSYKSWIFPKEICSDKKYKEWMREEIDLLYDIVQKKYESNLDVDFVLLWNTLKRTMKKLGSRRITQIKKSENDLKNMLNAFLAVTLEEIGEGKDKWEEYRDLRRELSQL